MNPDDYVELILVPVEVFGGPDGPEDDWGYGLCDAVQAWSDCNRANGRIYRVDDTDPKYREAGTTVKILVRRDDLPFFEKRWGSEYEYPPKPTDARSSWPVLPERLTAWMLDANNNWMTNEERKG